MGSQHACTEFRLVGLVSFVSARGTMTLLMGEETRVNDSTSSLFSSRLARTSSLSAPWRCRQRQREVANSQMVAPRGRGSPPDPKSMS